MKDSEIIFLNCLKALGRQDVKQLKQLLHPNARFEFPYALPSKPAMVVGRTKILENLSQRRYSSTLHEPLYIESSKSGDVYAEILAEETFGHTNKSYSQHIICKGTITDGLVSHYKEFFNPITRLQGLLDLEDDNIIILND